MDDDNEMEMEDTPRSRRTTRRGRQTQTQPEKLKYMEVLQDISNRKTDSITIDLADLKQVRTGSHGGAVRMLTGISTRTTPATSSSSCSA